ncbi:MAG: LysM peptidoglycan-binding domain-containing protein [Candidatus Auribacterota bacterium]|jgi:LysM repeat protein|nr:LysM peptidoglycan-binding domain-containing protein [Candidatus Auribacterota bacterium]
MKFISKFLSPILFCIASVIFLNGCAQELRDEIERRDQMIDSSMMKLQDKTLSAESRLDELNVLIIDMNNSFKTQLSSIESNVNKLNQQLPELRQNNQSQIDALSQQISTLDKTMNQKLKVILDEVLKENQRIIKRIRSIEEEVYGEATRPSIETSGGESGSAIIESGSGKTIRHTVKSGENLWSIAQNYGVSMEDIAEANNMESISDIIRPGQMLTIPVKR